MLLGAQLSCWYSPWPLWRRAVLTTVAQALTRRRGRSSRSDRQEHIQCDTDSEPGSFFLESLDKESQGLGLEKKMGKWEGVWKMGLVAERKENKAEEKWELRDGFAGIEVTPPNLTVQIVFVAQTFKWHSTRAICGARALIIWTCFLRNYIICATYPQNKTW